MMTIKTAVDWVHLFMNLLMQVALPDRIKPVEASDSSEDVHSLQIPQTIPGSKTYEFLTESLVI